MEWHITYYRKKSIRVNLPWKKFPWVSFKYKKHFTNKLGKCLISLGNPFCIKPKFDTFYGGTLKQLFIRISELTYIWPTKYSNVICWIWPSPLNAGLNKLHPQWQAHNVHTKKFLLAQNYVHVNQSKHLYIVLGCYLS